MNRLSEIAELEKKATKGPWVTCKTKNSISVASQSEHNRIYYVGRDPVCLPETFVRQIHDATFISRSRSDIPYLLERLNDAEAVLFDYAKRAIGGKQAADYFRRWSEK